MLKEKTAHIKVESHVLESVYLNRPVSFDCFLPNHVHNPSQMSLLLINDGQNMAELGLHDILETLLDQHQISPILCVGIHVGEHRKMEYGTAHRADYMGWGAKASLYRNFIINELLPFIHTTYCVSHFKETAFAGFSLGGLTALDMVWNHPEIFSKAGVFSGSLWWRTKSLDDDYNEDTDRIMHAQIRSSMYKPGLKFFFETGTQDETADRNNNGIIDSIDDTLGLIDELEKKGYHKHHDIKYLELADGKHDVATWARAMPVFLKWGWGKEG
jgi:enterochelin esterase-like enzyme